eukprot:TRINITY_DN2506_c0_g1_i1.p2 TRINITY_DN2506_c0_g1~~TRINITY_DN2506_c0_g1_i1.p2  ORF type:complete len:265 (-),score=73.22 TRINITY_DN2506_c0_g1_i1:10-804(-)
MTLQIASTALVSGQHRAAFQHAHALATSPDGVCLPAVSLALQALAAMSPGGTQLKDSEELLSRCGIANPSALPWAGLVAWLTIQARGDQHEQALSVVKDAIAAQPSLAPAQLASLVRFGALDLLSGDKSEATALVELAAGMAPADAQAILQELTPLVLAPAPAPAPAPAAQAAAPAAAPIASPPAATVVSLPTAPAATQPAATAPWFGAVQRDQLMAGLGPAAACVLLALAVRWVLASKVLKGPRVAMALGVVLDTLKQAMFFR